MATPEQNQTITPYLIVKDATDFLSFVQTVFSATEKYKAMRDDSDIIMHCEVTIGNSSIMFAQATEQFKPKSAGLFIYVDDADQTYARALENGCTSIMPLEDKEYGRTCGVTDLYDNDWWITSIKK